MISSHALVDTDLIGEDVSIAPFVVIASGVSIGNNVTIHPNVVISEGVKIGDGVELFPGTFLGKEPKGAGALARKPVFDRYIMIGSNSSIGPNATIFYDVEIGEYTLIGDGVSIREQCKVGSYCVMGRYVTINYNTTIGDYTKIMDSSHITGNCTIGSNVFISTHVAMTNDNKIGKDSYSDENVVGPVIDNGVGIGAGAVLLPGVRIAAGSIVSAGAVVTKDVDPNSVVMGIPARFVREIK